MLLKSFLQEDILLSWAFHTPPEFCQSLFYFFSKVVAGCIMCLVPQEDYEGEKHVFPWGCHVVADSNK